MKVQLILNLNNPNEKTIVNISKDNILYLDPSKISFEEFSKDHNPGEYLYDILGMMHYKCADHPSIPIRLSSCNYIYNEEK